VRDDEDLVVLPAELGFWHLSRGLVRSHLLAAEAESVEVGQLVKVVDDGIGPWLAYVHEVHDDGTILLIVIRDVMNRTLTQLTGWSSP
jgi:hypothetical protein